MYVTQIIMQYTLNLYSAVHQLYLNQTGRKKMKQLRLSKYIAHNSNDQNSVSFPSTSLALADSLHTSYCGSPTSLLASA